VVLGKGGHRWKRMGRYRLVLLISSPSTRLAVRNRIERMMRRGATLSDVRRSCQGSVQSRDYGAMYSSRLGCFQISSGRPEVD
jgi:hypothetical protein